MNLWLRASLACALISGCGAAAPAAAPPPKPAPVAVKGPRPKPKPKPKAALPAVLEAERTSSQRVVDDGLKGAWARVFLRANPGPYQYVAYEVTARGGAGVMSHLRGMMGRRDALIRTQLVSRRRLKRLFAELKRIGADGLRPPKQPALELDERGEKTWPKRSDRPVYELSFRLGGVEKTVVVRDPYSDRDPLYGRFINAVRAAVIGKVGTIGYHGPTGPPSRRGFLHVDSVPSSRVFIDGVELGGGTPILGHPIKAGVHTVVLESRDRGLRRSVEVVIRPGRSSSIDLDLR